MRWHRCCHVAPLLGLAELGGCSAAKIALPPFRTVAIGVGAHYAPQSTTPQELRRDMDLLGSLGVAHLRVPLRWDQIEPRDDAFDWSFVDRLVRSASERSDISLMPAVYGTRWGPGMASQNAAGDPRGNMHQFAQCMGELARRYRGQIDSWEIGQTDESVESYAALVAASSEAIRAADPAVQSVAACPASDLEGLRHLIEQQAASARIDAVSLHGSVGEADWIAAAAEVVRNQSLGQPLWVVGSLSGNSASATDAAHARMIMQFIASAIATGQVERIVWDQLRDHPEGAGSGGLLRSDGTPKPAMAAFSFARHIFAGPIRCIDPQVRVSRRGHAASSVHVFERWDKSAVVAGWLAPADDDQVESTPAASVDIAIPMPNLQLIGAYDELGAPLESSQPSQIGRRTMVRRLPLRAGKVTIALLRSRL